MPPPIRDLAIVLRVVPFEDRHRIVTAISLHSGLLTALAKNASSSRRFSSTLDLFVASEWVFSFQNQAALCFLKETTLKEPYLGLRTHFQKLTLASFLSELMLQFALPQEPCHDLFRLHANALEALQQHPFHDTEVLLTSYLAKLLHWSGYLPQWHQCACCQIPIQNLSQQSLLFPLLEKAHILCPQCHTYAPEQCLTQRVLQDFYGSLRSPIRKIQAFAPLLEHQALFQSLETFLEHHVAGFNKARFKSIRFIKNRVVS